MILPVPFSKLSDINGMGIKEMELALVSTSLKQKHMGETRN